MKAYLYDRLMSTIERRKLHQVRKLLLSSIGGRVVEFGAGTGVNFALYSEEAEVTAIEPDNTLREEALKKIGERRISLIDASAEELPFEDDTFDHVVITLALCTIPDPSRAIGEAKRVCRRGGTLLILEHIRNENKLLALLQDILTPPWKIFAIGCHLNRDTLSLIEENSFERISLNYFFGRNFVWGSYRNIK
ncbi:type 11 methyltransferase [Propionigenium maris DSM 9537]|uniref:Type 11 methyltransferase n=1 Tax=Propionigenium maris DSM 9537 TaxID=1123000 RepID=A0A9W6LLR2_9FUSO|nr:class I SAM-dependent methyltransferase [Propionigenium maris]GLI54932.1 type 11 methyltransferase [Propionigenium maris DSM 9537]